MPYERGQLINDGGEGCIYEVTGYPNLLMKIYNEKDILGNPVVTEELHNKLIYMQNNPPEEMLAREAVAWPLELLYDESDNLIGFVMPRMIYDNHISHAYNYVHPKHEAEKYKDFPSVVQRIKIALNMCSALYALHEKGYVVGDFTHDNIGVSYNTDRICLMDCDSFHITDENGNVYRTNVIMQGYLAPEIIDHCNNERAAGRPFNLDDVALPTFTKESDLFCLAVHIFKLLMNGADPFRGELKGTKDKAITQPLGNDAIEQNLYMFREGYKPSAIFCPPAEALPGSLLALFNDAFINGRENPQLRPDSTDWYYALENYQNRELTQCSKNPKHQYYSALKTCPYCSADKKMRDVLKGRKKWHDSIGIVASICAIIIAGGVGTGVILSLLDNLDTVVVDGGELAPGELAPAVVLWKDLQEMDFSSPPPPPPPAPSPTPEPTPEPLPPEGTQLRILYDTISDTNDDITIFIEWVATYDDPDDRGYTLLQRTEENPEWLMHNRWGDVSSVPTSFFFKDGALAISLPGIIRDIFYLNEDGTGVFSDGEEGVEFTWRLEDPDTDSDD